MCNCFFFHKSTSIVIVRSKLAWIIYIGKNKLNSAGYSYQKLQVTQSDRSKRIPLRWDRRDHSCAIVYQLTH